MLKIGHRGAAGYAPENTLLSFQKAIDLGVDMIELDVWLCKSGHLVVIHDERVNRTTNGEGYVAEMTLDELQSLDAGQGEKIPTLQEVFDLVNRKVKINVELKGENITNPVCACIQTYVNDKQWAYSDFFISSFDHKQLLECKALLPEVQTCALIAEIPLHYNQFAEELEVQIVCLDQEEINQALVDDAHQRGLKAFVRTVNEPEDIQKIKNMGVDGIFSNFPDRL